MRLSLRLAAIAVSAMMAAFATGCADTSQPDLDEAFGGSGSQEQDLTSSTSSAATSGDTVEEPTVTPEQAEAAEKDSARKKHEDSSRSKNPSDARPAIGG